MREAGNGDGPTQREVQTRLANFETVVPQYANLVHVNTDQLTIQIVFSRFLQPVVTTEEDRERWRTAGALEAEVVARVLLPPEVVDQAVQLLQAFLNDYFLPDADVEDASNEGR